MSPTFLYRTFDNEDYAKQFVEAGQFRLSLLALYKEIEDQSRQDPREGKSSWHPRSDDSRVLAPQGKRPHVGGYDIHPLYLFCTAGPDAKLSHLRKKFGQWVVRINDPSRFLIDLDKATPAITNMTLIEIKLEPVSYTRDEELPIDPNSHEAYRLPYTQKSSSDRDDHEFRYIATAKPTIPAEGSPAHYLYYDFNRKIRYAELL